MATRELYELQRVDSTQSKVQRRLLQIKNLLGENQELSEARQAFAAKEAEFTQWQTSQKDTELASQTLATRIQESDARLMDGQISNPKELESLQASVASLRRQQDEKEEEAVQALMMVENLTEELEEKRMSLNDVEQRWQQEQKQIQLEGHKLKQKYLILKKKRVTLTEELDNDLLSRYESLRKRKAGIAITKVENSSCGACNVTIPTGVLQSVQQPSAGLIPCPSCGRILHFN